jgi:dTDP-glucose pyrophosphorylase
LPAGVSYVAAKASQGECYPMADEPTITCTLGTIPPKGVAHINVVVTAASRGSHTNHVHDNHGNEASASFTIVRPLYQQ